MPRGRRPRPEPPPSAAALEQELERLKQKQLELRRELRQLQSARTGVAALEEKLENQLGRAKWTVQQIKQAQPDWDEWSFYRRVEAKPPAPRGRRRRAAGGESGDEG